MVYACTLNKALAVACDKLDANYLPKLGATKPVCDIGPFAQWSDPSKMSAMDPWGHLVTDVSYSSLLSQVLLTYWGSSGSRGDLIMSSVRMSTTLTGVLSLSSMETHGNYELFLPQSVFTFVESTLL